MTLIERRDDIIAAIEDLHRNWSDFIETDWTPKSLTTPCDLILATDGFEHGPVVIQSVLHAQLVVTLKMSKEWSWGAFEVFSTLNSCENQIEQNGLTYVKEVFSILEEEFDETCPALNRDDLANSSVFQALKAFFIDQISYRFASPENNRASICTFASENYGTKIDGIIYALLDQLETGHNPILNPESADVSSDRDGQPVITVTDNILKIRIATRGREHTASIYLQSHSIALAELNNTDLHMAMIWQLTKKMDSEVALSVIEELPVKFSEETERFQGKHDLATEEISEIIVKSVNGLITLH